MSQTTLVLASLTCPLTRLFVPTHPGKGLQFPQLGLQSTECQTWLQLCNQPRETRGHHGRPWLESACHLPNTRWRHPWSAPDKDIKPHNSVTCHPRHLWPWCAPGWSQHHTTEECEEAQGYPFDPSSMPHGINSETTSSLKVRKSCQFLMMPM